MEKLIQDVKKGNRKCCIAIVIAQIAFTIFAVIVGGKKMSVEVGLLAGLIWSCFFAPYFIICLHAVLTVRNNFFTCVQRNGWNLPQLEIEFQQNEKIGDMYVGPRYFFAAANRNVIAVPVNQITEMRVKHHHGKSSYYSLEVWSGNQKLGKVTSSWRENFDIAVKNVYQYNPYMKVRGVK